MVEDQEQVDKVLEIREKVPHLQQIFTTMRVGCATTSSRVYSRTKHCGGRPAVVEAAADGDRRRNSKGRATDTAAMFYTSGTTGNAKGVVLGYDNLIAAGRAGAEMEALSSNEEVLAYLPMAWVGQNIFSYTQWLVCGFTVNCPESAATVTADMREIGPTYYFAPPRVLEALLTQVMIRMEDASAIKRRMFHYFMRVARNVGGRLLDKQPVGVGDRLLYALGDLLVYAPLRNSLGMSRVRVAYTAGEAIGPDLFTFYRSLGINLKQLYGSTETSVFVCVQEDGGVKADTVGPPVKGRNQADRRRRNPDSLAGLFREYYKAPEATRKRRWRGWFHTGDAGYFDKVVI